MAPEWRPPDELGEYRLVRLLGRGSMGQVYLAYDTVLARHVAIKFIAALAPDPAARHRFLVEARATARLQHPNVVTIYHVGELGERPYLVSEFISGRTLERITLPVAWQRVLQLGLDLARGMAAAHQEGVLHRDIKPANIILTNDGSAKLVDFGLAKLVEAPLGSGGEVVEVPEEEQLEPRLEEQAAKRGDELDADRDAGRDADRTMPPRLARLAPGSDQVFAASAAHGTRPGTVMGTPYYMAPEIWQGRGSTARSDVYALGAVLYELCVGQPPHHDVPLPALPRISSEREVRSLSREGSPVDARFAALIERCLARAPERRFASGEELVAAFEGLERTTSRIALSEGNPYRGLRAFDAEHRSLFFGRAREVSSLIDRLRREAFVVVGGDSGVGKSSLCRAGLLPLLEDGALGDGRTWRVVKIVPGRRPRASLASAIAAHLGQLGWSDGGDAPWITLGRLLGDGLGLVVLIDQLEELITLSEPEEAAALTRLLAELAIGIPGLRLLATARVDFLTRLAALPGLGQAMSRALYILPPLSDAGMREAVRGPAAAMGTRFESEAVVDALVAHASEGGQALPLLQFALAELWEQRDRQQHVITAQALEKIGGVAGALARHADTVLAELLPAERAAARRSLTRLVTVEGTSARLSEQELVGSDAAATGALEALVRGRLVVVQEADGTSACKLAHEALVHGWATLRGWLEEDSGRRALRERLARAAKEWAHLGRAPEALWSPRQLAEAGRLGFTVVKRSAAASNAAAASSSASASADVETLQPDERAFLVASHRAVMRARWRRRGVVMAAALALVLGYAGLRLQARRSLDRQISTYLDEAEHAMTTARGVAGKAEELQRRAFARFDASERAEGEALWTQSLAASREVAREQTRASQVLEAALVLEPTRGDVRAALAEVLYLRALLAEREQHTAQVEELLERLELYDSGGEHGRRWQASASLRLTSSPVGAAVKLERFVEDARHKLHASDPRQTGVTPLSLEQLAPGSYLLTLTAADRATVRYPIALGRGQSLELALQLPAASEVPAGMIYVPAGRFLFGSRADEDLRRGFFNTVPQHERSTGDFLIARSEVTYGDWLEFLRQLPPDEQRLRTPQVAEGGFTGSLALQPLGKDRWRLSLQPSALRYTAAEGEQIEYRGRSRNAAQDWRRFPVAGITAEDAEAYLAWLRASRRVPDARLCSEAEWERAARGADGREFPHGGQLDPDDASFDETYGKQPEAMGPDEVGSHPASRSPFGVDDLCGNVFEWATSSLDAGEHVVRGGSYLYDRITNQISNRQTPVATFRDANIGMRVCATFAVRSAD